MIRDTTHYIRTMSRIYKENPRKFFDFIGALFLLVIGHNFGEFGMFFVDLGKSLEERAENIGSKWKNI